MKTLTAALALALTACATITPPPDDESARIVVEDVTAEDVVAAFVAEGLTIDESSDTSLRTVPADFGRGLYVTYRATISGGSAILSGTVRNTAGEAAQSAMAGVQLDNESAFPLHSAMEDDDLIAAWQRLESVAGALR